MPARQHNPTMIHLSRACPALLDGRQAPALDHRPATRRAPVPHRLFTKHRMALTANTFHT